MIAGGTQILLFQQRQKRFQKGQVLPQGQILQGFPA
jgi:hypothetical protein